MFDILQLIPGKKKTTPSGWISFNAVCCHYRGHKADKKMRGGLMLNDSNNWTYHCFNCNYKASFVLGRHINNRTRLLLKYCGIHQEDIEKYNLESLKNRSLLDFSQTKVEKKSIVFEERPIPDLDAELLDIDNPNHQKYIDYLNQRKIDVDDYPFMCTPHQEGRQAERIIVPYTFKNKIVGHTSRYFDNRNPKFINDQQPGYVFGIDLQQHNWEVCVVSEGIFDALSVNGCALMHNTISDMQADILRNLNRKIIIVPDHDKTGLQICDRALDLGFYVALPNWAEGIKDINDAVIKYGKLATLISILESATNSKIKIEIQRKKIDRRL